MLNNLFTDLVVQSFLIFLLHFSPARLRELDLDAFADELKRQEHGDKHITLYDIRKELNNRYRDYREAYQSANPESIFSMVTHETPETLHVGRLVECRVLSVATRRPRPEQLDNANPTKNEINGLWMCPFCQQDNFQLLNHVMFSIKFLLICVLNFRYFHYISV